MAKIKKLNKRSCLRIALVAAVLAVGASYIIARPSELTGFINHREVAPCSWCIQRK
jgi:hypothetical protein